MTNKEEVENSLKPIEDSPHLSKFLNSNFDTDNYLITKFEKLKKNPNENFEEELTSLKSGIQTIENNIKNIIINSRQDFLQQVKNVPKLEEKVEIIETGLSNLENSMELLQENIGKSHQKIEKNLKELKNNIQTKELLRSTGFFLRHLKQLKENKNSEYFDLAKASISIFELEKLSDSKVLRGIKVIDKNLEFIRITGVEIRKKSKEMLENGMKNGNQSEISTSLQVYHNLHSLNEIVTGTVSKMLSEVHSIIRSTMDPSLNFTKKKKSPSSSSKPGSIQRLDLDETKNEFYNSMREMFSVIHKNYIEIWYLNDVLSKKKDPIQGVYFSQLVNVNKNSILDSFWTSMTTLFHDRLHTSVQKSSHLKNLFVEEYCQILQIFTDFIDNFKGYHHMNENWILEMLEVFEKQFISLSVNKIFDKISLLFSKVISPLNVQKNQDSDIDYGIPSAELRGITLTMVNELHSARNNQRLLRQLAKVSISKGIDFFVSKMEYLIISNSEAYKLYEIPTRFQKFNSNLYNSIFTFLNTLLNGIETFSIQSILLPSINKLEEIANLILAPFFKPMVANLEKILIKIHKVNYKEDSSISDYNEVSKYCKEFDDLISVIKKSHLSLFQSNSNNFINNSKYLVSSVLSFYVKQICLIHGFSEEGKLKLIQEMSQIELSISSNIFPVDSMKGIANQFKGLRNLLFLETNKISIENTNLLDSTLVLNHLLSRIPNDYKFKYPNELLNLSIEKYSEWMDENETTEVKKILSQSFGEFEKELNKRKETQTEPLEEERILEIYKSF